MVTNFQNRMRHLDSNNQFKFKGKILKTVEFKKNKVLEVFRPVGP